MTQFSSAEETYLEGAFIARGPRTAIPQQFLYQYVEAHARLRPHAVALRFEREDGSVEDLTYCTLNARANALAARLEERGVRPGDIVGVCINLAPEAVLALLALHKLSAAPYFLDPSLPPERLAFLCDDTVALLLVQAGSTLLWSAGQVYALEDRDVLAEQAEDPVREGAPDALAYVIATSGTEGMPKAVPITQRALVNFCAAMAARYALSPEDRVLEVFSFYFDAAMEQLATALYAGAALCFGTRSRLSSGPDIIAFLQRHGVTHASFTPSILASLPAASLPALRSIACGGERLSQALVERWIGGRTLTNVYGPTECTIGATTWPCQAGDESEPPIGRPLPNVCIAILDAEHHPLPAGVRGEIAIGGVGVSRGYLNRPELTAARFLRLLGESWYLTGDCGVLDEDGVLRYGERIAGDLEVKVAGGRRFDLGELETKLLAHPAILECGAAQWQGRLVAYLVCRPEHDHPSVKDLRIFLQFWLPDYAIPQYYLWQPRLPRTSSGKIARQAFAEPDWDALAYDGAFAVPRTPTELALAHIVAALLAPLVPTPERINTLSTFSQLGLDSLSVTDLLLRAQTTFGSDVDEEEGYLLQISLEHFARLIDLRRTGEEQQAAAPGGGSWGA
jgi:amino acid adenylation domain-containing protein